MKCQILTNFCVPGALSLTFSKRNVEKWRIFSINYASHALAYYSARSNGKIIVDTSFDCTESHEKNEGLINEIR